MKLTLEWKLFFVGCFFGFLVGTILIPAFLEGQGDSFEQKTLDEVCHKFYGNNTHQVSTNFLVEKYFECQRNINISEKQMIVLGENK